MNKVRAKKVDERVTGRAVRDIVGLSSEHIL